MLIWWSCSNLRIGDRSKSLFFQFIDGLLVLSEVQLCTHQNYWYLGTVMPDLKQDPSDNWVKRGVCPHLRIPLGSHILKAGGVDEWEAYEENVLKCGHKMYTDFHNNILTHTVWG